MKQDFSLHFSQSFNKRTAKFEFAIKNIFSIMTLLYFLFFLVFRICIPDWQTQVAWMKCTLWSGLPDPGFFHWCYRVTRLTFWTFCMRPTLSFQIQVIYFHSIMSLAGHQFGRDELFWILNICFDFFHCACLQKTTTNIRYSKSMSCRWH